MFCNDVIITSSEILADVFSGCVGVAVTDVDASGGGCSQPTLPVTREALS